MNTNESSDSTEFDSRADVGLRSERRPLHALVSRQHGLRRSRAALVCWALVAVIVMAMLPLASASASLALRSGDPPLDFQGEGQGRRDHDARQGRNVPTGQQQAFVAQQGAQVRWNAFGTPAVLTGAGPLASGLPADEVAAARAYILANRTLFRLSEQGVANLELIYSAPLGAGRAVLLRQRFGNLPAGHDGLIAVGVVKGSVVYVSSTIAGDGNAPGAATVTPQAALQTAAADAGRTVAASQISEARAEGGWRLFTVAGFTDPQRLRLVALPTPQNGVRTAWEMLLIDNRAEPLGFSTFVDAQTNAVLLREDLVTHDLDNPEWRAFPVSPPLNYASRDSRELWCWTDARHCDRVLSQLGSFQWDLDPATNMPTFTTIGNAARSTENWNSADPRTVGVNPATPAPDRNYTYPWTNQWNTSKCDPAVFTSPQRNDIDAALANLFAMHNQMHDWSYQLGFTEATFNLQQSNFGRGGAEADPEQGNGQAGGIVGGPPAFAARDNANQITPADGIPPITNMYLWQPVAGAFYAPCVDGDYDMTVVGHEYTHAITNRMVAGPTSGLSGFQAGSMGESWSDLIAMEQLHEYSLLPISNENPWAVGPYVTGDKQTGIRNYPLDKNPLNYSDIGYDTPGPEVHSDGEVWNAVNFEIRQAMVDRYKAGFPANNRKLQLSCALGQRTADQCPGNRRWIQLVFDSLLLMTQSRVSMVDARDALLAADQMRFGGANQDVLWNAFAIRGLGQFASSNTNADTDPVPSFESPFGEEATVVFNPLDTAGHPIANARLFVGQYEARAVPVADTDAATALSNQVRMVSGTYDFIVQAPGYGLQRFTAKLKAIQVKQLPADKLAPNLASSFWGATASGDGTNQAALIDDTEATNWASLGSPVAGKQVTVLLAPAQPFQTIRRVQVSAMLRPAVAGQTPPDPAQSRFSALRQFEIWTCLAGPGVDCTQDSQFQKIFTSPANAFPSIAPRPRAPELIIRSFKVPQTNATHVRLRVVTNQCTGTAAYAGDQDNDPNNNSDCITGSVQDDNVRAAELQVFSR